MIKKLHVIHCVIGDAGESVCCEPANESRESKVAVGQKEWGRVDVKDQRHFTLSSSTTS